MGRFAESGTDSEEFHEAMREAGPVECSVKGCGVRFSQGSNGMTLNVCEECIQYVCNDHLYRHPVCSLGR